MPALETRTGFPAVLIVIAFSLTLLTVSCDSSVTGRAASSAWIKNSPPDVSAENITVNESDAASADVTATDPNGDNVSLAFSSPFNSTGYWQTRYDSAGIYTAYVIGSDDEDSTISDFLLEVKEVHKPVNLTLRIINPLSHEFNFTIRNSGYNLKGQTINQTTDIHETKDGRINLIRNADSYTFSVNATNHSSLDFNTYVENSTTWRDIYLKDNIEPRSPENISFKGKGFAFHPLFNLEWGRVCFDTAGTSFKDESRKNLFRCDWEFVDGKCIGNWHSIVSHKEGSLLCHNTTSFSAFALGETLSYYCGDGVCDDTETCSSCPEDCGVCPSEEAPGGGAGEPSPPSGGRGYAPEEPEKPAPRNISLPPGTPLLDVVLKILHEYERVRPGGDILSEVLIYNLGTTRRVDVEITYSMTDAAGNGSESILIGSETLAVETSLSKLKIFSAPKKEGYYTLFAEARYSNHTANSSDTFWVEKAPAEEKPLATPMLNAYAILVILIMILIILVLMFYEYKELKSISGEKKVRSSELVKKGLARKKRGNKKNS
ncbi:MAG: hypothetical protein R6U32_07005 [Candidatus Woesearchaeota archaeon]